MALELWKYYRKLYRRKWLIIVGMIICVGVAGYLAFSEKTEYTFVSRVMERTSASQGANILPETSYTGVDPELRLSNLARIAGSTKVKQTLVRALDEAGVPDARDYFEGHVEIYPERESMLLHIGVTDTNPETAQLAVSTITQQFSLVYQDLIYGRTRQREYIAQEMSKAGSSLGQAREALARYKEQNDISDLNSEAQVRIARTSELESQWRSAQVSYKEGMNRLKTVENEIKKIPLTRKEQSQMGENQLWLSYQQQLASREQDLASMMVHRGPSHPEVKALQETIDDLKKQMTGEQREKIVSSTDAVNPVYTQTMTSLIQAKVENLGNKAKVQALGSVVPQMKARLASFPEHEKVLTDLTFEAKAAENTYALLRQKLDEAKIRESEPYAAGVIQVVDDANPERMASNKKLKVALALPLSILLSCMLIFLLDYLDNTIRTPEEAEELLGLPIAAMIPLGRGHSMIRGKSDPGLRESFQMLAASLWYQSAHGAGGGGVLVASAEPNAGRSVTAGNLAASLAADGARVILVDADLRQPAQHLIFGVDNARGFSNILAGTAKLEDVAVPTKVEGLLVVPSGPLPENPMRLIRSEAMEQFFEDSTSVADFVIFDSPAGSAFADATVLASYIKRVLLVQSAGRVPRGAENEFKTRLEQVGVEFIGVVLNKVRPDDSHSLYHFRTAYASLPSRVNTPAISSNSPAIPG